MTKIRELSVVERAEVIGAWKCDVSKTEISKRLEIPLRTIYNIIEKYNKEGTVENDKRSGRPKSLSDRDKRALVKVVRKNRKNAVEDYKNEINKVLSRPVSTRTVQRNLHEMGYYARAGKRKPLISEINRKKRCHFVRCCKDWLEWNEVIFSDESRFNVFDNDSQNWVWRQPHEKYNIDCLVPKVAHSPGIMVWGCFTRDQIGPLIQVDGSITGEAYEKILKDHLLPFIQSLDSSKLWVFQDDNARPHRAGRVEQFKQDNDVLSLPWPPQSPDLNPIENLWDELERRVRKRENIPRNKDDLFAALEEEWYQIDIGHQENRYKY
jgi:transposase